VPYAKEIATKFDPDNKYNLLILMAFFASSVPIRYEDLKRGNL
tara:strand:+ start:85095 stop:85223 length:129 start_codon:yes stop_codon:yes gene_type:complete